MVNETAEFNFSKGYARGEPRANQPRGVMAARYASARASRAACQRTTHREEETLLAAAAAAATIAASQTEKFEVTIAADASTHTWICFPTLFSNNGIIIVDNNKCSFTPFSIDSFENSLWKSSLFRFQYYAHTRAFIWIRHLDDDGAAARRAFFHFSTDFCTAQVMRARDHPSLPAQTLSRELSAVNRSRISIRGEEKDP